MFNLLNPALTPLKAKLLLFAAGAVLVLLAGSIGTSAYLLKAWQASKVELGQAGQKLADTAQLVRDNAAVWALKEGDFQRQLQDKDTLRTSLEKAAAESKAREARYDLALAAARKKLEEATRADPEANRWSDVPVPAAVIGGMCGAVREALGEAGGCAADQDGIRDDSRLPAGPVPGSSTT